MFKSRLFVILVCVLAAALPYGCDDDESGQSEDPDIDDGYDADDDVSDDDVVDDDEDGDDGFGEGPINLFQHLMKTIFFPMKRLQMQILWTIHF